MISPTKTTTYSIALVLLALCHAVPSLTLAATPGKMPTIGKVVKLTPGDRMCYVDLIDDRGKQHNIGADFAICNRTEFLNKRVRLTYKRIRVNDCNSNEPCGKTRTRNAIVKMTSISPK